MNKYQFFMVMIIFKPKNRNIVLTLMNVMEEGVLEGRYYRKHLILHKSVL